MTIYVGFIRTDHEKIWFWISCWDVYGIIDPDDQMPVAA